jgi:hypothetical protein
MSMWKDRKRSVGVSNWRSSPPRPVLTTARVGIYGYIHTIYIRRYGTRDTTLAPWISKATFSQGHRATRATDHRLTEPPATRLTGARATGSQGHWIANLTSHHLHHGVWVTRATTPMSHRATRPVAHRTHRCQGALAHRSHQPLEPWCLNHQPLDHRCLSYRCYNHQNHRLTGAKVSKP